MLSQDPGFSSENRVNTASAESIYAFAISVNAGYPPTSHYITSYQQQSPRLYICLEICLRENNSEGRLVVEDLGLLGDCTDKVGLSYPEIP